MPTPSAICSKIDLGTGLNASHLKNGSTIFVEDKLQIGGKRVACCRPEARRAPRRERVKIPGASLYVPRCE